MYAKKTKVENFVGQTEESKLSDHSNSEHGTSEYINEDQPTAKLTRKQEKKKREKAEKALRRAQEIISSEIAAYQEILAGKFKEPEEDVKDDTSSLWKITANYTN